MRRRLLIFSVGLVLSITLRPTFITAQQRDVPRNETNIWSKIYEYMSDPLFPQWVMNLVTTLAALYAFRAFTATKVQADTAEMTLKVVQRPNVFLAKIEIIHLAPNERPAVILHFLNQGGSPASKVVLTIGMELFPDGSAPTTELCRGTLDPAHKSLQGPFTIAAGQYIYLPVAYHKKLSEGDIGRLLIPPPQATLWVFGAIEFDDPLNKTRVTSFYSARYIVFGWDQERPKFPSDFWIFNDFKEV